MTKKKKIIISVLCIAIVLSCIITAIIFATLKKFSIKGDNIEFNKHTKLTETTYDSTLTAVNYNIYENGTQLVRDTNGRRGVYSYIEGKLVIPTEYKADIKTPLVEKTYDNKTYFKMYHTTNIKQFVLFDEKGEELKITHNKDDGKTYGYIKQRKVDISESKNKITTKVDNEFDTREIEVIDIALYDQKYMEDNFNYEIWALTGSNGIIYHNLYEKIDGKWELIQTLNNIGINSNDTELVILTDGTPMLKSVREIRINGNLQSTEYTMYDINFNKKNTSTLNAYITENQNTKFTIGNSEFIQCILPATEDDHDIVDNSGLTTKYYNLETYKFNLRNGGISKVNFNYFVQTSVSSFNPETTLLAVRKINKKQLTDGINMIVNEKLQFIEINYEFNTIQKINNDRYLVSKNGTSNFNIIDKKYKLIASLDDYNNIFVTENSIIGNYAGTTVVCNTDGVIISAYANDNITNVYNEEYYLRTIETELTDGIYTQSYICKLTNPDGELIHSAKNGSLTYKFNNKNYSYYSLINEQGVTLQVRAYETNTSAIFNYEFYTIDNTLVGVIENQASEIIEIKKTYDNHAILSIGDRYIVVDR